MGPWNINQTQGLAAQVPLTTHENQPSRKGGKSGGAAEEAQSSHMFSAFLQLPYLAQHGGKGR